MSNKGLYIAIEGGEGSGKSTYIKLIKKALSEKYPEKQVILTREPGGTVISEKFRDIVVNEEINPKTELLLYLASRVESIGDVVEPHIEAGDIVISDRCMDSSYVYQGVMRGLGIDFVDVAHKLFGIRRPDLTIYLDVDPVIGLSRKSGGEIQKFEKLDLSLHRKIRDGYLHLYKDIRKLDNIIILNTDSGDIEKLFSELLIKITECMDNIII